LSYCKTKIGFDHPKGDQIEGADSKETIMKGDGERPIKAAIVGLGWWGRTLNDRLTRSRTIKVTHGVDPAVAASSGFDGLSDLTLTADFEGVLRNPEIDAVIIATPHLLHEEQAMATIAAGKHVFCEKPLTLTVDGAARLVEESKKAGLVLGVGHERRFETTLRALAELAKSGQLGEIMHVDCNWSHQGVSVLADDNWRKDPAQAPCGMFTGLGIHITDWVLSTLGPVAEVSAKTRAGTGMGRNSASVAVQFTMESGVDGWLCCLGTTPFYFRLVVFGTAGWAELRQNENVDKARQATMSVCLNGKVEQRIYDLNDAVLENLDAWGDAILGKVVYPISHRQLVHNIEIMQAIVDSSYSNRSVAVKFASP
jgi:predicted dehydrogenase